MKFLFISLVVLTSMSLKTISVDEIIEAFKLGDASKVSKYFDNTVEITLTGTTNTYSKRQAELVMRDFFSKNVIKQFRVIHKASRVNHQCCLGELETANGPYRVSIYFKQQLSKQLLHEIRFERLYR